jgi:hypothetical protein
MNIVTQRIVLRCTAYICLMCTVELLRSVLPVQLERLVVRHQFTEKDAHLRLKQTSSKPSECVDHEEPTATA